MAQKGKDKEEKYWKETEPRPAWDRVKDALHRDWEQTRRDFGVKESKDLHQNAADTMRQATGREVIPKADLPNPRPSGNHANATNVGAEQWERVKPPSAPLRDFSGWGVRPSRAELAVLVQPGLRVVCSNDRPFAIVDYLDGERIKLRPDVRGQAHWIPLAWVTHVDAAVHVDRPGDDAMRDWSTH
jgi:hypothetical protein